MSLSDFCTAWMIECLECHCQTWFSLKHFGMWWMTMTKSRHSRVNDSKWPKSQAGLCEEEDGAQQSCLSESAMLNTPWHQGGSDGIWPWQLTERLLLFSHWHSLQSATTVTPVKWNYTITDCHIHLASLSVTVLLVLQSWSWRVLVFALTLEFHDINWREWQEWISGLRRLLNEFHGDTQSLEHMHGLAIEVRDEQSSKWRSVTISKIINKQQTWQLSSSSVMSRFIRDSTSWIEVSKVT